MKVRARYLVIAVSLLVTLYVGLGALLGRTASEGAYRQMTVFSEVFTRVQSDYVEDPNLERVTVGALRGMLEALDPYSGYLSPREYAEYREQSRTQAEGEVGAVLSKRFGLVSIVTVLPASPALRAGLRTGDLLESIGGFSTREMSIGQAYHLLAGEVGSKVKVALVRQTLAEPQAIEMIRARPAPTRVLSQRFETEVAYLKIAAFDAGKAEEVGGLLEQFTARGATKLILDLRDCATGTVEEAVATAQLLLEGGVIASVEGQKRPRRQFNADPARTLWHDPVAVLIDNGTAGPAEILAAAVLENGRGHVIGQRSYGVGSVQELFPLEDGAALILSVAKYYGPAGKAIQDNAVTPSVAVEPDADQPVTPVPHTLPAPGDPVVLKALEVLRTESASREERKAA
ncbi:MAG: S41 family peptidase [Terriglobia bacterium]